MRAYLYLFCAVGTTGRTSYSTDMALGWGRWAEGGPAGPPSPLVSRRARHVANHSPLWGLHRGHFCKARDLFLQ